MITLEDILATRPCYTRERIETLAAGRTVCTPADLLRREDVPIAHRVWLGCQLLTRRDRARLVEFAEGCAARACAVADVAGAAGRAAPVSDSYADAAASYAASATAAAIERDAQIRDLIRHLNRASLNARKGATDGYP